MELTAQLKDATEAAQQVVPLADAVTNLLQTPVGCPHHIQQDPANDSQDNWIYPRMTSSAVAPMGTLGPSQCLKSCRQVIKHL